MADVFISYQRAERDAVTIIAEKLTELRLDVWFDSKLRPGGTFDEAIATQLEAAKAVLACWTPSAIASEWVRGEATLAHQKAKLVTCFLEPTQLLPPFNLTHAEDLTTWAGQEDAPAWLKILERIGQLVGRPDLAAYPALLAPETSLATLRVWANANGDDPLVEDVWARIALLEGEDAAARIAREKVEARVRDRQRKVQEVRSRELAKARGRRAGRALPARFVAISVTVLLITLLSVGYVLDSQRRERLLSAADTPDTVRDFLMKNNWHPIANTARLKLTRLDEAAWETARRRGTIAAFDTYLAAFADGTHRQEAEAAKVAAERVREIQSLLARLGRYAGLRNGDFDTATRDAIKTFQFERGMVVTGMIDDTLAARLHAEIERFTKVQPDELVAKRTGPPTLEEYRDIAARLAVDAPTLEAVRKVESSGKAFDADGHPIIVFERHIFSRLTGHRFDESHPQVSGRIAGGYGSSNAQWSRLKEAYALDPEAAYKATTFGMFQILGQLHKQVGFETVAEYARFVSQSEANQVEVFARFVEGQGDLEPLQCLDWARFARRWNGPNYKTNKYDERLRAAYLAAATQFGVEAPSVRPGCK
jgi:hypothetical protein